MLRRVLITAAVAAAAAPAAHAQPQLLMPGVTYERLSQVTPHGPVVAHVLRAPRPNGLYSLKAVLGNDTVLGRERLTGMQRRHGAAATIAGVNGDLFAVATGTPSGLVITSSVLAAQPNPERSSTGVAPDGSLRVERVRYAGTWQGSGQRRPLLLNRNPGGNGVALYTPQWGLSTPAAAETVELVLQPFPAAQPMRDLVGTVVLGKQGGGTPIPRDGAVLVARGAGGAGRLAEEAPLGANVTIRLTLTPDWSALAEAVGGGPMLVRQGSPIFRANELFTLAQLVPRQPRSGIGQAADGSLVLVTVDGRRPGYSVGMTNFELALLMTRLGAQTASALDGGGSATMAFEGLLLNRPSDRVERAIGNSLNVFYYGVHAPAPPESVVSPNGDGVAERQTLSYKIVRPSTVRARLFAPDGTEQMVDEGEKTTLGTYRFTWAGPGPEGSWRFLVEATDDLGRYSSAERTFSLNNTLAALRAPSVRRGQTMRATFALSRPARVRTVVLTASGATVRTLSVRNLRAGTHTAAWNGRTAFRSLVGAGRYQLRVTAQNDVGSVSQAVPFTVRR